ncbi:MAG TPA: sulfotransferase domain-containing protein [Anaerolineales bacterium]|nr:sulfotransferase domain-containing protein [Anaerolineales bacterium]
MIVLAVGMPRAGSGWHYNLTHDLVRTAGAADSREVRLRYRLEDILTEVNCNLGVLSLRRLARLFAAAGRRETFTVKLHAGPTVWGRLLIDRGWIRPTYIYRDPRDALVSAYEYGERARAAGRSNAFSPLADLDAAIDFIAEYVGYWEEWTAIPGCHILRYEDLRTGYEREAARLARFLGVDPEKPAPTAVIDRYRPELASRDTPGLHFAKGISGRYRESLSPTQQRRCLDLFGDRLERMGYPPG